MWKYEDHLYILEAWHWLEDVHDMRTEFWKAEIEISLHTFKWVSILRRYKKGRGYALVQPGEVIAYALRKLEPFEEN